MLFERAHGDFRCEVFYCAFSEPAVGNFTEEEPPPTTVTTTTLKGLGPDHKNPQFTMETNGVKVDIGMASAESKNLDTFFLVCKRKSSLLLMPTHWCCPSPQLYRGTWWLPIAIID